MKKIRMGKKHKYCAVEDWKKVLFSDESHFFVQENHIRFVRFRKGKQLSPAHFNEAVKHLQKMFWASFSFSGVGSLMSIEGIMNSDKYIDVIERKVIPDMGRAFPDGEGIFQQDIARVFLYFPCLLKSEDNFQ